MTLGWVLVQVLAPIAVETKYKAFVAHYDSDQDCQFLKLKKNIYVDKA